MGSSGQNKTIQSPKSNVIADRYRTFEELEQQLRKSGVESIQSVFGYDFSKSNQWTGERTYSGRSLHDIRYVNPYIHCMQVMAPIALKFDDD